MANWTNIPTDRIEPGKPIRAIDGLALRDNPIAIAEGASGAPKIREAAMDLDSINGNRLRGRTVTQAKLAEGTGERDWVGRRVAAMGAGAVGTYAFVTAPRGTVTEDTATWGGTIAGSSLRHAAVAETIVTGEALSGTWRVMGARVGVHLAERYTTLAVRIS